jgi:hypothetical protein
MSRHPSVEALLEFFDFDHLPAGPVRQTSAECSALVGRLLDMLPGDDPETSAGLRKLIEAKDCFVRAQVRAQRKRNAGG